MRFRTLSTTLAMLLLAGVLPSATTAQSAINLAALRGLAPFSTLLNTPAGNAALVRNLVVTNAIQTGSADQPAIASFRAQEAQALRDAFITGGNARELADGLGTKLGAVYQAAVRYTSSDDGKTSRLTSISPSVAALIGYTFALTGADSGSGKYFFADETAMTGTTPAPGRLRISGTTTPEIWNAVLAA